MASLSDALYPSSFGLLFIGGSISLSITLSTPFCFNFSRSRFSPSNNEEEYGNIWTNKSDDSFIIGKL